MEKKVPKGTNKMLPTDSQKNRRRMERSQRWEERGTYGGRQKLGLKRENRETRNKRTEKQRNGGAEGKKKTNAMKQGCKQLEKIMKNKGKQLPNSLKRQE